MKTPFAGWLPVSVLTVAMLAGATANAAEPAIKPNVVVIVADDLRQDALGCYGSAEARTPNLDRLASRGALFTRATCSYPICNVSRSEMISGRLMLREAATAGFRGGLRFDPAWTLWPEHMKRAGWHTLHTGKWHVTGTPSRSGFVETAGLFSSGGGPAGVKAAIPKTPTGREVTGYTGWTFKTDANEPQLGLGGADPGNRPNHDRSRRRGDRALFGQTVFSPGEFHGAA